MAVRWHSICAPVFCFRTLRKLRWSFLVFTVQPGQGESEVHRVLGSPLRHENNLFETNRFVSKHNRRFPIIGRDVDVDVTIECIRSPRELVGEAKPAPGLVTLPLLAIGLNRLLTMPPE